MQSIIRHARFAGQGHLYALASSIARPCCSSLSSHAARLLQSTTTVGSNAMPSPYLILARSYSPATKSLFPSSLHVSAFSRFTSSGRSISFCVGEGGKSAEVADDWSARDDVDADGEGEGAVVDMMCDPRATEQEQKRRRGVEGRRSSKGFVENICRKPGALCKHPPSLTSLLPPFACLSLPQSPRQWPPL